MTKSRQAQMQAQPVPAFIVEGDGPWANIPPVNRPSQPGFGTFLQQFNILAKDHVGKNMIVNAKGATWTIGKGSVLVGSQGALPKFTNEGVLRKKSIDPADESFIDLEYNQKRGGQVIVENGTLTFRGGGTLEGTDDKNDSEIMFSGNTPTLRLGSQPNVNRTLYQVLNGKVKATAMPEVTASVFAVDDRAVLSILGGAQFRAKLPATLDRVRGGFELNGGEIIVARVFLNQQDFTWRSGAITTSVPTNADSSINKFFINTGKLRMNGNMRKTLAGLLVNNKVISLKAGPGEPSALTINGGVLINANTMCLEEGTALLAGPGGGLLRNETPAIIIAFPTRAAGANSTVTIATELDNHGNVTVRSFDKNSKMSLKLTGSVAQFKDTTLAGGEWTINGGNLDFNGRVINQLGKSTGEQALVCLENGGTFPALQLQTIEKKGALLLGSAQTLVFPGSLTNRGTVK